MIRGSVRWNSYDYTTLTTLHFKLYYPQCAFKHVLFSRDSTVTKVVGLSENPVVSISNTQWLQKLHQDHEAQPLQQFLRNDRSTSTTSSMFQQSLHLSILMPLLFGLESPLRGSNAKRKSRSKSAKPKAQIPQEARRQIPRQAPRNLKRSRKPCPT